MKNIILLFISIITIQSAYGLSCSGTEPFWSAEITKDKIKLDLYVIGDASHLIYDIEKVEDAIGFATGFLQVYSDSSGPIAVIENETCNDGMSDFIYNREIVLFSPNGVLYGCCDRVESH